MELRGALRRIVGSSFCAAILLWATSASSGDQRNVPTLTDAERSYLRQADMVFVGRVAKLGEPPPAGSGIVIARQAVVYRVERMLAGKWSLDRIAIHHVVAGPPTVDPQRSNALNPTVFAIGRRVLVAAKWQPVVSDFGPGRFPYLLVDDNDLVGPLPAAAATLKAAVAALNAGAQNSRPPSKN